MLSQVLPSLSSRSLSVASRGLPSSWAPTGYGPIALAFTTIDLQLRPRLLDHSKCSGFDFHAIPSSAWGENSTSSFSTESFSTSSFSLNSRSFRALFWQQALPYHYCPCTDFHANSTTRCVSTQHSSQLPEPLNFDFSGLISPPILFRSARFSARMYIHISSLRTPNLIRFRRQLLEL